MLQPILQVALVHIDFSKNPFTLLPVRAFLRASNAPGDARSLRAVQEPFALRRS
jgi:hypothetical protein